MQQKVGGGHNPHFGQDKLFLDIFWVLIPKIFGWNSIFSLLPLCTKLARMPQNRHFRVELVPAVLWLFLGYIWVSLVKRPPNRPLMMSQALDEVLGLVLVRTGLAKTLKIDKIWNTVFSVFFALLQTFFLRLQHIYLVQNVVLTRFGQYGHFSGMHQVVHSTKIMQKLRKSSNLAL